MRDRGSEFMLQHSLSELDSSCFDYAESESMKMEDIGIELPSDWECLNYDTYEMCCGDEWCFNNTGQLFGTGGSCPIQPTAQRIQKGTAIEDVEDERWYDLYYGTDGNLYCSDVEKDYCKFLGKEKTNYYGWLM